MHDLFRRVFDSAPHPMAVVSPSGAIALANPSWRALDSEARSLEALFGSSVTRLMEEAKAGRGAGQCLTLPPPGDPPSGCQGGSREERSFLVTLAQLGEGRDWICSLVDLSTEVALRNELASRTRELSVLNGIGSTLSTSLELEALWEIIYQQTSRIMNTSNFYIALHDADTNIVRFPLYIESDPPRRREASSRALGNGMTEYVLTARKPLLLNGNVEEFARSVGINPVGRPSYSWLGVPMIAGDEAIGVIAVQDHVRAGTYSEHDVEVLSTIASQAAVAVRNALLFAKVKTAYEELSAAHTRLLEAERIRSINETVGALNHEINNPLCAMKGNAQLLLANPGNLDPVARAKVQRMLDSVERIRQVTQKMSNLIQASSMPYPGQQSILDVHRSVARGDAPGEGRAGAR